MGGLHEVGAEQLLDEARAAHAASDWARAAQLFDEWTAATGTPLGAADWRLLIGALRAQGALVQAEEAAERALRAYPDDIGLLSQSAYNAKAAKDRVETVVRLERLYAAEGDAPSERTCARLVAALRVARRAGAAEARCEEGLERYPNSARLQRSYALIAQGQQAWNVAAQRWRRLGELNQPLPPDEETYEYQAAALRKAGDLEQARAVLRAGLAQYRKSRGLRAERAALKAALAEQAPARGSELDRERVRRHPYQGLAERAFWNRAVENRHALDIADWYRRKFSIAGLAIAAAGSCFAQHIGRQLRRNGYRYVDVEPPPSFLKPQSWLDFGYGMYSARYGNVYTPRQLLQLLQRALGEFEPEDRSWVHGSGHVDPFRPTLEPEPYESVDELLACRQEHLLAVRRLFETTEVFVFTLGLTEAWECVHDGAVFPVAPGVSGGVWDPQRYRLRNLRCDEVLDDMERFLARVREINPGMKFILTVSPVPLMATATDQHVVVATSYSKSVLRAAAGQLAARHDHVDYFPSYEIIGAPAMRAQFYNPDMRTVSNYGVDHVMRQFFAQHRPESAEAPEAAPAAADDPEDIACDEELLRAFGEPAR